MIAFLTRRYKFIYTITEEKQHALRAQAVKEPVEASTATPGKTTPSWVKYQGLITRLGSLVCTHSRLKLKMKPKYPRLA